ncbi:MAG: DUF2007 domain-containing protein [Bacteroidetes bacterium]|nr:DUF2007 domain-containing protein [Bacteroidota bacterium]
MMANDWVSIYSSGQFIDLEAVKALLAENEIGCISMDKRDSAYLIGDIEIYVQAEDALKAKQLIIQFIGE